MKSSRHGDSSTLKRFEGRARAAPALDPNAERALLAKARAGDERATEQLVLAHFRLVLLVARRYRRAGIEIDDLVSEGLSGLLEAIRRFDLTRENGFSTYAGYWVRARIQVFADRDRHLVVSPSTRAARVVLRGFDRASRVLAQARGEAAGRSDVAAALGVSEDDVALVEPILRGRDARFGLPEEGGLAEPTAHGPSPEQEAADRQLEAHRRRSIECALATLSERERFVVERQSFDDVAPLAELGAALGVSPERVRQLQSRAHRKLRSNLADAVSAD